LEISHWITLLKQYGPLVGLFLGFIIWQTRKIDQLLNRNSAIYEAEIKRMADTQERLLSNLLGEQPSSSGAPTVRELHEQTKQAGDDKKGG
jgi:hypothetical protein